MEKNNNSVQPKLPTYTAIFRCYENGKLAKTTIQATGVSPAVKAAYDWMCDNCRGSFWDMIDIRLVESREDKLPHKLYVCGNYDNDEGEIRLELRAEWPDYDQPVFCRGSLDFSFVDLQTAYFDFCNDLEWHMSEDEDLFWLSILETIVTEKYDSIYQWAKDKNVPIIL